MLELRRASQINNRAIIPPSLGALKAKKIKLTQRKSSIIVNQIGSPRRRKNQPALTRVTTSATTAPITPISQIGVKSA